MKKIYILILYFIFLFSYKAYADTNRDLIIQKELDCIDQHKNSGLTWSDVCSMPGPSNDLNNQIVNQQMDQAQGFPPREEQLPLPPENYFNDRVHTFSVGPDIYYYHFYRPLSLAQNPSSDFFNSSKRINSVWYGADANYTFRPPEGNIFNTPIINYYALDGFYAIGRNEVNQSVQSTVNLDYFEKLNIKEIPGSVFDARILLGRDFIPLPVLRLTPYTGFGIRDKTDQSGGHIDSLSDGTTVLGWNVSDLYYYIPTGLTLDLAVIKGYEISLNMEYDYLVKGYERDDYSNFDWYTTSAAFFQAQGINFTNQNLRYSLNRGWGDRFYLKFLKHLSSVDIYFEPYLRYWHINVSKVAEGSVGYADYVSSVNKNNTLEAGSSLGVQF